MNLQPLLSAVRRRATHLGISTAAPFLRELTACLGGLCPSKVLGDVSAEAWAAMLKEAENRLVYHDLDMAIGDCGAAVLGVPDEAGGTPTPQGKMPSPQLPPHTLATFPAVITTTRQDRDGDVLETLGAELDPAAPLLWQHLTTEPIGRLLKEGKRTKTSLSGSFAVAATALGQDAALLAEHGALRISHGFLPDEFEPLDAKDAFSGFHVTRFKILEVSLVSVPSNPDAVITQFSREKLHHPLVKAWAGAMFRGRPLLVSGAGVSGGVVPYHSPLTTHPSPTKAGRVFSAANEQKLQAAAANYKAIATDDEAHPEVARLADKGYQCVKGLFETGGDSGDNQDDMDAYTADGASAEGDGKSGLGGKSGRAVSAQNAAVIQEAIDHGVAIKSHGEATPGHKSMAKTAITKLKAVLGRNQAPLTDPDDDMDDDGGGGGAPNGMAPDAQGGGATSFSAICKGMLATAMSQCVANNDLAELQTLERALRKARRQVRNTLSRIERQREHDAEAAAIRSLGVPA